jgi:hypothetical protein
MASQKRCQPSALIKTEPLLHIENTMTHRSETHSITEQSCRGGNCSEVLTIHDEHSNRTKVLRTSSPSLKMLSMKTVVF